MAAMSSPPASFPEVEGLSKGRNLLRPLTISSKAPPVEIISIPCSASALSLNSGAVTSIFAPQSDRIYCISGTVRKVFRGTAAAPALAIPKYAMANSGELLRRIATAPPLLTPRAASESAKAAERPSNSR